MVKITIFGLGGTGTSTIRELLTLKTNFISKNASDISRGKAKELGIDISEVSKMSENDSGKFDKSIDDETKKFGEENDNFIFEGRLAWFFIPDSVKIKISCDDIVRFERIAKRDCENLDLVIKKINKREISDKNRYFNFYGIEDYTADKNFDLIIDSTNKTPEDIVQEIIIFLKKLC